jgi:hypothetical protein
LVSPQVCSITAGRRIHGVDMTRFPSAVHPVSRATFCPTTHESAGKTRSKSRTKGNP